MILLPPLYPYCNDDTLELASINSKEKRLNRYVTWRSDNGRTNREPSSTVDPL